MAEMNVSGCKTFEADEAIAQYRRVKMDADGKVTYADATDASDGVSDRESFAAGEKIAVMLKSAPGTRKMTAAGAITAGDAVYGAADGKVATDGFVLEGKAIDAATADGDIIEVMPLSSPASVDTVASAGSAQGDAAALTGLVNVVSGGDDTKGVILPAATAAGPGPIYVLNSGSAGLKIYPATSDKINNGSANAAITILENTLAVFVATAADNWAAMYTVNS